MCGICGFTGRIGNGEFASVDGAGSGRDDERRGQVLTNMMNRIIHRGPDGGGQYMDDGIAMGFRRLSIIDLRDGDQPMKTADGRYVITFNGEIYNYRELREELKIKGHTFRTNSDTEVLLHGYSEHGTRILDRLRGMFAFAIWDTKKKELFCARDMFGIKPFYYAEIKSADMEKALEKEAGGKGVRQESAGRRDPEAGSAFVYGSEIKSILEYPGYERQVNLEALEQYLSFQYSVLPETFFKGIYRLPAGYYLVWKNGRIRIRRYFDPVLTPREPVNHKKLVNEIDRTVQESIRYHMVSDVEVASLLSSGVDSSYVAANFGGKKTFTVGFDYETYNEIPWAQAFSKQAGIENYSKIITTKEYWEEFPRIQYFMDEPLADASAAALYFVDREASKHVKVILSGEGSDELFGGYVIYHEPLSLDRYQKLPAGIRKAAAAAVSKIPGHPKGKGFILRGSRSVEERFIGNANVFSMKQRKRVLRYSSPDSEPKKLTAPFYRKARHLTDPEKMQYIDLNFWLQGDILLKADKMSMAHGLESRVPFLDRGVYLVAKDIPLGEKISDENTKTAFREAARRYMPESSSQKKKLGFPVPIRVWLRQDKYYSIVKEAFLSKEAEKFFHVDELMKLLDAHYAGKEDYSRHIWCVYTFLVWYRQYFVPGACSVSIEDELAMEHMHDDKNRQCC